MALALFFVTAKMYTSFLRMYKKDVDPRSLTGASADTLSVWRELMMCDLKAEAKFRLQPANVSYPLP